MFDSIIASSSVGMEYAKQLLITQVMLENAKKQKEFEENFVFERKILIEKYDQKVELRKKYEEIKKLVDDIFTYKGLAISTMLGAIDIIGDNNLNNNEV